MDSRPRLHEMGSDEWIDLNNESETFRCVGVISEGRFVTKKRLSEEETTQAMIKIIELVESPLESKTP